MTSVVELPSNMAVGFRFYPTEEELISHYLRFKILGKDSLVDHVMAFVDFCSFEPWELPYKSKIKSDDQMWWFVSKLDYKYSNSKRAKRTTKTGYWKITGKERDIIGRASKLCIGKKRVLVFHEGPTPGKATDWVMHEYYLEPNNALAHEKPYVICRLEYKSYDMAYIRDLDRGESSGDIPSAFENLIAQVAAPEANGPEEVNFDSFFEPVRSPVQFTEQDMSILQFLWEDDETDENRPDFADSLIVEPEENICFETSDNVIYDSSQPTTLKRSYFLDGPVSSDTDNEGVNERYIQNLESSSSFASPGGSKKFRQMRMVNMPSETIRTSTSAADHSIQETIVPPHNQFSGENVHSPVLVESVNRISFVKEDRPDVAVTRRSLQSKRIQPPKKALAPEVSKEKVTEAATKHSAAVDLPQKQKSTAESQNGGKMKIIKSSNSESKHLKSARRCESPLSNWKSVFTFVETSSVLSRDSTPLSVYYFNTIVGTVLFAVFVRELVLYGSWC